jgi:periplasmic divalent cation tolerance protein
MTPVIVFTTVGATFDAAALAKSLVEKQLAACVNIVPQIRSIYRWQGKVEDDSEQLLLIKTTQERVAGLRETLFARHPYEVPEFVVITIDSIEGPYREWLLDALQTPSD